MLQILIYDQIEFQNRDHLGELLNSTALQGDRIAGTTSGEDPRVKRDAEERIRRIQQLSVIVAITCDLPWLSISGMVKKDGV